MEKKASVFKNKNFLLLFQGTLTSDIAATFYSFALSLYILSITDNNAFLQGVYLAVCGIVFVVFSFVGGVLADRWDKVKIVYLSDFIKGILILVSAVFMYLAIENSNAIGQLVIIFIIGIINNIIAAIFKPASTALIPELVEEEQLQQTNSFFSVLSSFVSIVGIILAGILYSYLTIILLFIIIGALYIASGISELFIKAEHIKKEEQLTIKTIAIDFKKGFNCLWNLKPILYVILGALFLNFFFTPFASNLMPYYIKTDLTNSDYLFKEVITPELFYSILSALLGIGSLIMAIITSQMKQKEKQSRTIKFNLLLFTLLSIIMAIAYFVFSKNNINIYLMVLLIVIFFIGVALIGINVPFGVAIQKNIPKDMLAKVSSVMNIGSMGLVPFSTMLGGVIISSFGIGALFIFINSGLALVTIFLLVSKEVSKI